MKKFYLLTKTLLVAVCLLVGASNAWGQIIYSWEGGDPSATETGGTAVASDEQSVNYSNTANQVAYKTIRLNGKADFSTYTVTITLSENTLQAGDVIRVTGYRNNSDASKTSGFKAKFNVGSDNVASSSGTDFNNIYSSGKPNTFTFEVPSSAAGSSTITMTRSHTGTNLFITKIQVVRPVVNADINFSNAISDGAVAGTVNSMALSNTSGSNPFEKGYNGSNTDILRVGNGTGTVTIPDLQLAGARDEIVLTFDYYFGKFSGKYAGFYLRDKSNNVIGALYYDFYNSSANTNTFGFDMSKITSVGSSGNENDKIVAATNKTTFEIHLIYTTGKMYAKQYTNGTLKQTTSEVSMGSANPLKTFEVRSSYNNDNRRCWFDNLYIKTIVGDYSTAKTITYVYKDNNDTDISELALAKGGASSAIGELGETFTPTYPASFTDDDYAYDYTYASGGDAFTVTGNATVTLVYTKSAHATTDVTVKYKYNSTLIKEEKVAEGYPVGKPLTYWVSKYVLKDGVFYQTTQGSSYYQRTENAEESIDEVLSLSNIENVVFFTEAEDLENTSVSGNIAGPTRLSHGTGAYFSKATTATTLSPGKYKVWMQIRTSTNTTLDLYAGETKIHSLTVAGNTTNGYSEDFVLTSNTDIIFPAKGGNNAGYDCIFIVKTGDVVNLNSSGYATYSAKNDVEISGAKAYTAALDFENSKITCAEITSNKVPAGNGVLLFGDASATVTLSYTTEADALASNNLKATTLADGTLATKGENTYYALSGDTFKTLTGDFVHNKAYFEVNGSNQVLARSMRIAFAGDITGVANVEAAEAAVKDGKFIENGKLVIVKNGKKFNAAGAQVK